MLIFRADRFLKILITFINKKNLKTLGGKNTLTENDLY